MNASIPVYIEERKGTAPGQHAYVARALFHPRLEVRAEQLNRTLSRLTAKLTAEAALAAKEGDHRALSELLYAPPTRERTLDIAFESAKETVRSRCLFVELSALGTSVAFTPLLMDLWFTVANGETLKDRAQEFFAQSVRQPEGPNLAIGAALADAPAKAWIANIEIDTPLKQEPKAKQQNLFALLTSSQKADGLTELHRTGRCLNDLYPDDLDRVLFREDELATLTRIIDDKEPRPVLILGPHGAGKTALLHEYVYRAVSAEKKALGHAKKVWLLSPQRLISGMSYVGQWEDRVYAILDAAKKKSHVLYFDDLIGLFLAGVTSQSQLSVADLLKRSMERREIRIVGETTPAAFRVLQETDRSFADLFDVLPLREPPLERTLRILIRVVQQLEARYNATFSPDVLPAAMDLQRRYVQDAVFPGKGAAFLRQLAIKHKGAPITRATALQEFRLKSGLSTAFLDDRQKLSRAAVLDALKQKIIGQAPALEAFADAVSLAKAHMNDPQRPLASFLFLGPTGVGKTQCAKALAEYLFGSADKLLRFDLNEYVDAYSAAKLTGTAREPEGLLTSAVRREPFAVLLFDEIEKADASVHDLLLQVLGEGRLTDARGRTADFTNCIVILTSNLGVREAGATIGLKRETSEGDASVFIRAAETFFRPEFFNRLDRVIPFQRLQRDEIRRIAELLIRELFKRDGLVRRRCILQVHPAAMERVVDAGYHPTLGARALKRSLEKQLTRPVAAHLASAAPDTPAVISLYPAREGIAVHVDGLIHAESQPGIEQLVAQHSAETLLERSSAALKRIAGELDRRRPRGEISASSVRPEHHLYFMAREQHQRIAQWIERTLEALKPKRAFKGPRRTLSKPKLNSKSWLYTPSRAHWSGIFAAHDITDCLTSAATEPECAAGAQAPYVLNVLRQTNLLQTLSGDSTRAVLLIRALESDGQFACEALRDIYVAIFSKIPGTEATILQVGDPAQAAIAIEGPPAWALAASEAGAQLRFAFNAMHALQVIALPVNAAEAPEKVVAAAIEQREQWLASVARGERAPENDPFRILPVNRIYHENKSIVDLRSGVFVREALSAESLYDFIVGRLPLVSEFSELL